MADEIGTALVEVVVVVLAGAVTVLVTMGTLDESMDGTIVGKTVSDVLDVDCVRLERLIYITHDIIQCLLDYEKM